MKKMFLSILILFNCCFAGEIGYVWFASTDTDGDDTVMPDTLNYVLANSSLGQNPVVGTEIYIKDKNILFKNKEKVERIIKEYDKLHEEKICTDVMFRYYFYTFSNFYDNIHENQDCSIEKVNQKYNNELFYRLLKSIKAKILDIDVYGTKVFFKIEILSEIKPEEVKSNDIEIKEIFLCDNEESTLFSCEAETKKVISICANKNNTVSYKYGVPDKIEMEYTYKEGEDINKYFKLNMRNNNLGLAELEFNVGKYTYTVFKYLANFQISHSGVGIYKNGNLISIIKCIYPEESNYVKFYNLEDNYKLKSNEEIKDVTGEIVG